MKHQTKNLPKPKLKNKDIANEAVGDLLKKAKDKLGDIVFGTGITGDDKVIRRNFVERFVSSAISEVTAAIEAGLVDPAAPASSGTASSDKTPLGKTSSGKTSSGTTSSGTTPPGKTPPGSGRTGQKQPKTGATTAVVDINLGKVLSQMRKLKTGTKPMPPASVATLLKDITNARYNKDWAINTGTKILKYANAGYDVTQPYQAWMKANAIGRKQNTIAEQAYNTMNALFESIIDEIAGSGTAPASGDAAPAAKLPTMSVSDYLFEKWWPSFMRGVRYDQAKIDPVIKQMFDEVGKSFGSRSDRQDTLQKIAMTAYALQMDEARKRSLAKAGGYGTTSSTDTSDDDDSDDYFVSPDYDDDDDYTSADSSPKSGSRKMNAESKDKATRFFKSIKQQDPKTFASITDVLNRKKFGLMRGYDDVEDYTNPIYYNRDQIKTITNYFKKVKRTDPRFYKTLVDTLRKKS